MVRVDSNWLLSPLLRLPGPSHMLAVPLVDEGPVLRLALLAAVLQYLAPPALLQAFRIYLPPAKDIAVGTLVQLSRKIQSSFELNWEAGSHLDFNGVS